MQIKYLPGYALGALTLALTTFVPLHAQMATLSAPTPLSPANGATLTPDQLTTIDWSDVTGSSTPITYRYESSNSSSTNSSGGFSSPAYQSGVLTTSQISAAGTPPGTYYWHARAVDNSSNMSDWSPAWSINVVAATSTPTTTPPTPTTTPTTNLYYPNAFPVSWFLLPGQQLSFYGNKFAPNETITIQGDSVNTQVTADGGGNFTANNVLTIPYSWANSQHTYTVQGSVSDGYVTPKPITIYVGSYYPQIVPSSWWIRNNQSMSVTGYAFAPNEQVRLMVNGNQVAQSQADGSGNVSFSFTTPSSGSSATLTAQGVSTGLSSSRTIYLYQ